MTKPKTVTIDGQEYELVPVEDNASLIPDGRPLYALKPITAVEEKKQEYILEFNYLTGRTPDGYTSEPVYDKHFLLTEQQATALADAIQALVEYVQASDLALKGMVYTHWPTIVDKARSAYHE